MADKLTDLGLITPAGWGKSPATIAANSRLLLSDTPDEADLQLKLETLSVLHSIRGLIIGVLVVVPILIIAAVVIMVAIQNSPA